MDIMVERRIAAPPEAVAAVMFDADHDPAWIGGAEAVRKLTPGPLGVGSRVRRDGGFLGRKFHWVTEVTGYEPDRRLDMAFMQGPMKGGVTYEIEPDGMGSRVSIRNHGGASFSVPGMGWMMRNSVAKDLQRLAVLVERRG
jgi:uncharacterized protein YndB with AHSA1/START domain